MGDRQLVVGGVIVDSIAAPSRILAARRSRPGPLAGRWEFAGGKVESGETPEAALIREIDEELGVTVDVGAELRPPSGTAWPISASLEIRLFVVHVTGGEPRPGESHDEIRWLGADELESVPWLDADVAMLPSVRGLLTS